ncbi:NAD-dependent malic enzyme [Rubrivirga marina]|uniref:NAD-dependent malic enzyme n=1 Tax=Rubrivirga marina TaxID=1196024 RepID=UPI000BA921B8|nr:NAD-dependent malic enzyme [Rubrivirga marina]
MRTDIPGRPALPDYDVVLTVRNPQRPGMIGRLLGLVGDLGALVGDIETRYIGRDHFVRDVTLSVFDEEHLEEVLAAIRTDTDTVIVDVKDLVFERHAGGKIRTVRTTEVERLEDLRTIYTPGVARVCRAIQKDPALARQYTAVGRTVGIFTNGTRVLGLGNIGALASLPVMEGKSVLYDRFVGLGAVPIVIDETDPEAFVDTVCRIAPSFGGIHLEDIRTPDCFWIEDELIRRLPQPVMHDDQHGTATVLLAAVLSALRHTGREGRRDLVCAQVGLGAAGLAIARLLLDAGFEVVGVDPGEDARRRLEARGGRTASLEGAAAEADILIATTGVIGLITPELVRPGQIVLALSNPVPEITPEAALAAGAAFAADGRSVNNALAFPGLFKAALDVGAPAITSAMKVAAAEAISALAPDEELVPSPFHPDVHEHVIKAVRAAASV